MDGWTAGGKEKSTGETCIERIPYLDILVDISTNIKSFCCKNCATGERFKGFLFLKAQLRPL